MPWMELVYSAIIAGLKYGCYDCCVRDKTPTDKNSTYVKSSGGAVADEALAQWTQKFPEKINRIN